jgi:hypothetical protein
LLRAAVDTWQDVRFDQFESVDAPDLQEVTETLPAALHLETFSYLPRLSDEQVARQVEPILHEGLSRRSSTPLEPGREACTGACGGFRCSGSDPSRR